MNYVKYFTIKGVDTKQVACIELQGAPNAATEGAVGVLGMDMTSPTHEVYRCVAVNGSVYTWELLSAGMSIVSAKITREGAANTSFPYEDLKIPTNYLLKVGDLILDTDGYLYQVSSIGGDACYVTYSGTHLGGAGAADKDYRIVVENGKLTLVTENGNVLSEIDFLSSDESTIHRDPTNGKASVMAIRTVTGDLLHIFVGTKASYNALSDSQKQNLFAIITDDTTKENIEDDIQELRSDVDGLIKGDKTVHRAENANLATEAGKLSVLYAQSGSYVTIGNGLYLIVSIDEGNRVVKHSICMVNDPITSYDGEIEFTITNGRLTPNGAYSCSAFKLRDI